MYSRNHGLSTLVNHAQEGNNPMHAHVGPIYQTSTFGFSDVAAAAGVFEGERGGIYYTRISNPNSDQLAAKYAILEGIDILRSNKDAKIQDLIAGKLFSSGMAAISGAIQSRAKAGDTVIAQRALYGNAYAFLNEIAPRIGIHVIWVEDTSPAGWEKTISVNSDAVLIYMETPVNPTMKIVDLEALIDIAHNFGLWVMIDNTFATPFCQRPLKYGADVVIHSTTKYLSGHGAIVGGVVISTHLDYMTEEIMRTMKLIGGAPSPFDAWLANLGLKTFELRMIRHCENAMAVARYLQSHEKVAHVNYPGLPEFDGFEVARKQMYDFGGMLSFELKGGFDAGEELMNNVQLSTLAVSLGNVDSLIQHPASMTHRRVPPDARIKMGISDGLVRFSVGIENKEDIIEDLDQSLAKIAG